jgi:NAD(P)-dependent dehydrogenase (short-subunit alcohol dehydrogenase family)
VSALAGRRVLLTGASRGIGRVVASVLARDGASLFLVARDRTALDDLAGQLPGGPHDAEAFDVRDQDAWAAARPRIAPGGMLHGIVTAAAALPPVGAPGTWEVGQFRDTLDINVTGTLLAVLAAHDALRSAHGSIVTFSGGGATAPLPGFDAYACSKAAVVRLTENLAVELADAGVRANSVAPGLVATDMHRATLAAGPDAVGSDYYERTRKAMEDGTADSPDLAAELVAFLLSDASAGITGKLISARWDPWRDPSFQQRLRSERDLATLRRVDDQFFTAVPSNR